MAVDHDKELDLEDLEIEEIGSGQPRGGVLSEDDLEEYGVWVKVKPHPVTQALEAEPQETSLEALDAELPPGDAGLTEEEEQLLGSLEESSSAQSLPEIEDLGELSIPEEEGPGALEPDSEQVELELSEEPVSTGRFDDLASLEEEIAASPAASGQAPRSQMLQKIEEELAAIRGELAALKSELVHLRQPGAEIEVKPPEAEREAGFFSDDSDETIALTGDELDNILNTAEITEEEASEQALGEEPLEMAIEAAEAAEEPEMTAETAEEAIEPLEAFSLDEPIEDVPTLDSDEVALEVPAAAQTADSIELELPDVEEIGLDSLEEPAENLGEELTEEPLEELEIELTDESLEQPPQAASSTDAQPARLATRPEAAAPADDELVLDDLEPLEALEMEPEPGEALPDEIALEVPEIELPADDDTGLEELTLDVPEEEIAEAADVSSLESEEPAEAEALEEVAAVEEPLEEIEELTVEDAEPAEELPAPTRSVAAPAAAAAAPQPRPAPVAGGAIPGPLKDEIRTVLKYMDQLLEALPDDKIEEFANSEYFEVYRRLFEELEIA